MKKLLVATALITLSTAAFSASAANSYGKRFYAGFFANYAMPKDGDIAYEQSSPFQEGTTVIREYDSIEWDDAFGMGIFAGYNIFEGNQIGSRAELEISYQKLGFEKASNVTANSTTEALYDFDPSAAWKFMANAYVDVPLARTGITPYIGGGVGMAVVDVGGRKGNDTVLAWQGIIGASYAISSVADVFVDYRHVVLDDLEVSTKDSQGNTNDGNFLSHSSHNIAAGVRFSF